MTIEKILFVCLGNTARSPVAEYLARYYTEKHEANLIFQSAGFINAFSYMQPESQEYLNSKDIDHSDFKPQLINRKLLEKQDLILTMESSQKNDIINKYHDIPGIQNKTFTLKEYNGQINELDIIDPYYGSKETYQKVLNEIDKNVAIAIKKIIESNSYINDHFTL